MSYRIAPWFVSRHCHLEGFPKDGYPEDVETDSSSQIFATAPPFYRRLEVYVSRRFKITLYGSPFLILGFRPHLT